MKYYDICGYHISQVAQGCMRISNKSYEEIDKLIKTDLENGINFFDNADIYGGGNCEKVLGNFLSNNKFLRDKIILQTKCGIKKGEYDFSEEHILSSVDNSLKSLKTDYIDFLLLHRPDILCEPEVVASAFMKLKKAGKVKNFGVSNHNPMQIELLKKYIHQDIVFNQLQFSITNTSMIDCGVNVNMENEKSINRDGGILDYCRLNDITIQPWSPFQYGFFNGTFIDNPEFSQLNSVLREISEKYGITTTGLAIAWILRHPAKMQPIIGTTNIERIQEISKATEIYLTRSEWYKIYLAAGNKLP